MMVNTFAWQPFYNTLGQPTHSTRTNDIHIYDETNWKLKYLIILMKYCAYQSISYTRKYSELTLFKPNRFIYVKANYVEFGGQDIRSYAIFSLQ